MAVYANWRPTRIAPHEFFNGADGSLPTKNP